ncbi:MAG TPA: hypothetical protein VL172_10605 [Kofleriaceae bacterium]|nr:hypothetical protein [Kofleriaceae bacterium]
MGRTSAWCMILVAVGCGGQGAPVAEKGSGVEEKAAAPEKPAEEKPAEETKGSFDQVRGWGSINWQMSEDDAVKAV